MPTDRDLNAQSHSSDPARSGQVARVASVARDRAHHFSKQVEPVVRLVEGHGIEGDAHFGTTVQHRSRVRRDPTQPNLRQVHLIPTELFATLAEAGHRVQPGALGENVATSGVDLLALPTGTLLLLGATAEVEVTGLRNPCRQIDTFSPGLLGELVGRDADGAVVRRAGVMGVVRRSGEVRAGDDVTVVLPEGPHRPLEVV
jgi:MOSC domain-containing protein YiiM